MAKAKKLPSGRWRVLVYSHTDKQGKRHYESFTADSKKEAEYMAAEFAVNKKQRAKPENKTVGECVDDYISNRENVLSPSTVKEYKSCRNRWAPELMDTKIGKLTNEIMQFHIDRFSVNHSPKSCRNLYGLVSSSLRAFSPNLVFRIKLPQRRPANIAIPTNNDIKTILEYVKDSDMEIPILLAATGGLRRSEIAALDYSDIDYKHDTVTIKKALVMDEHRHWVVKAPKTESGNRTIQLPHNVIEKIQERNATNKPLITVNPSMITDRFKDILEECQIHHFRFHDLRHYNASVMLSLGIPDKYAMGRMGHSTPNMLKNVYQHLMDDKEKEVNESINNFFSDL